jgi:hypothetical protein
MDWAIYQPRVRFDARAERKEYEFLFNRQARVLQDRMARAATPTARNITPSPSAKSSIKRKRQSDGCCIRRGF